MTLAILSFFPGLCGPPPCKNDPKLTPNDGKLISGFGQKWSPGGPEVVLERWFVVSQQNHTVLTRTCCSAKIMIVCQDHHPLPRSSSSAKIMILFQQYHDFCMVTLPKQFAMTDLGWTWGSFGGSSGVLWEYFWVIFEEIFVSYFFTAVCAMMFSRKT